MRTSRTETVQARLADAQAPHDVWRVDCFSSLEEMADVIETFVASMAERGYPEKDIFGARLALEEAICNAIKHGHAHDPTKIVELRHCFRQDHLFVAVEDQGPGFDPTQLADATAPENLERPSGRGLLLMRHYAAWVRHNRAGNCVTFCIYPSEPLPMPATGELLLVAHTA